MRLNLLLQFTVVWYIDYSFFSFFCFEYLITNNDHILLVVVVIATKVLYTTLGRDVVLAKRCGKAPKKLPILKQL